MRKLIILGIIFGLMGCSSNKSNQNKTVEEIYNEAFKNTFSGNYSYRSKTYNDDPSDYTITQCQYYIDQQEKNYISYTWSYEDKELFYGAISVTAEEKLLKYEASQEQGYTLTSSYQTIVTTKTNLFENDGVEVADVSQINQELRINYFVSDMYIELTVQITDDRITKEECFVYEDDSKKNQLYYNNTTYSVNSSDYATDFEQARNFKNQAMKTTLSLQK